MRDLLLFSPKGVGAFAFVTRSLVEKVFAVLVGFGLLLIAIAARLHRGQTKADMGAAGLYGVVGRMGGGKSYLLALAAYTARKRGRQVWANYKLEGALEYRSWEQVLAIPHCQDPHCPGAQTCPNLGPMILMDEVHLWWPSEAWRCPPEIMAWCSQLRKLKITMFWASQHDEFVARRLRRLTFGMWKCVRFRRGHQYTLYEAVGYGTSKQTRLARMNVVRKSEVMASYDTLEIVSGSVEWGDGQGFEDLTVKGGSSGRSAAGSAQRSGRPGAAGPDLKLVDGPVGLPIDR